MTATAVLDVGKTNIELVVVDDTGAVVARRSRVNLAKPGPPWRHLDLEGLEAWFVAGLRDLARAHALGDVVAVAHGSAGVLVDDDGPALPAMDYEDTPPADVLADYAALVPPFPERGSGLMGGASHLARQLLWMRRAEPEAVARARAFLALPQYLAWRLTGVAVSEWTMLGAQSHLWSPLRRDWTALVDALDARRLLPPVVPPWEPLGPPLPAWGLPAELTVRAGIHDSTANLHRYERTGLNRFTLLSTGTWIVGMSADTPVDRLNPPRGMGLTTAADGRPIAGTLAMVGREHAHLAGDTPAAVSADALDDIIRRDVLALPGFASLDGVFPGSAGRGRIVGAAPAEPAGRAALAALYAALVSDVCLDLLAAAGTVVVDGGFTREPAFAGLLQALRPELRVLFSPAGDGTVRGAALLAQAEAPPLDLQRAAPWDRPDLAAYRARWRDAVARHLG